MATGGSRHRSWPLTDAKVLARHDAVALATARREQAMAKAVDARKLVGQTIGILMERYDLDGDQAFAVLRRPSQHNNTKLNRIARQLIDAHPCLANTPGSMGPGPPASSN